MEVCAVLRFEAWQQKERGERALKQERDGIDAQRRSKEVQRFCSPHQQCSATTRSRGEKHRLTVEIRRCTSERELLCIVAAARETVFDRTQHARFQLRTRVNLFALLDVFRASSMSKYTAGKAQRRRRQSSTQDARRPYHQDCSKHDLAKTIMPLGLSISHWAFHARVAHIRRLRCGRRHTSLLFFTQSLVAVVALSF